MIKFSYGEYLGGDASGIFQKDVDASNLESICQTPMNGNAIIVSIPTFVYFNNEIKVFQASMIDNLKIPMKDETKGMEDIAFWASTETFVFKDLLHAFIYLLFHQIDNYTNDERKIYKCLSELVNDKNRLSYNPFFPDAKSYIQSFREMKSFSDVNLYNSITELVRKYNVKMEKFVLTLKEFVVITVCRNQSKAKITGNFFEKVKRYSGNGDNYIYAGLKLLYNSKQFPKAVFVGTIVQICINEYYAVNKNFTCNINKKKCEISN